MLSKLSRFIRIRFTIAETNHRREIKAYARIYMQWTLSLGDVIAANHFEMHFAFSLSIFLSLFLSLFRARLSVPSRKIGSANLREFQLHVSPSLFLSERTGIKIYTHVTSFYNSKFYLPLALYSSPVCESPSGFADYNAINTSRPAAQYDYMYIRSIREISISVKQKENIRRGLNKVSCY